MIQIRPVSDLRNKFSEIEEIVNGGEPVYLTKNGYGTMVVMSLERYASLTDVGETKLDEAIVLRKQVRNDIRSNECLAISEKLLMEMKTYKGIHLYSLSKRRHPYVPAFHHITYVLRIKQQ